MVQMVEILLLNSLFLINGSSFGNFSSSRGVRQGDPLSPLLFNIAMEGFSRYLDRVAAMGQFSGFSNVHNGIVINHLHYADDTIFFLNNSRDELHNLFSSLKCFELIAGLKINTTKTRLISIGDCQDLPSWALELGCITDKLPFIYLGLPLGAKANSKAIWDPVLTKFDVRLSHLSKISLSKGGGRVYFWYDKWNGDDPLNISFPDLFRLSKDKYFIVASHISNGSWVFDFKRRLWDNEVNQFASFLLRIGSSPPILDNLTDTRRWSLGNNGVFSVKTLYSKLIQSDGIDNFPYRFVWNNKIPPKVSFLVWCAVHGKLNTKDMLLRKGMTLEMDCIMCGDVVETASHLLLHCKVAYKLWLNLIPSSWCWISPQSLFHLANGWHQMFLNHNVECWNMIPAAIVWVIWGERNVRTFENKHIFKTDFDLIIEAKSLIIVWDTVFGHHIISTEDNWDAIFS
ncbi:uncharacterized protein LOC113311831 [Papaver somniferum]|uniref:uncharacterized protein LOC113311831 n=1 Tax=Papaver somniferum TaxID=3469 RepID=UPI000E7020DB|nr:uncharacterized protein LOC113311831 [Papaver somniferum]